MSEHDISSTADERASWQVYCEAELARITIRQRRRSRARRAR